MPHSQTLEVRTTSLVQMTHSYWPLSMSSWILVGRSSAVDFSVTLGGAGTGLGGLDLGALVGGADLDTAAAGCPGTNSTAAALNPLANALTEVDSDDPPATGATLTGGGLPPR